MNAEKVAPATEEQIRPIEDWVLVRAEPLPETSAGGVHLDPNRITTLDATYGVAVAVGPGKTLPSGAFVETRVRAGDRVVFLKRMQRDCSQPLDLGDHESRWMIREGELLAVIPREDDESWRPA